MSTEIEVDESCFLLPCISNCVVEGEKRVRGKRGREAENVYVFTSCYTPIPLLEGMLNR
ncbi:hypothetical protein [Campylobacter troglodytis]|uniref:hypothetical protein n=1 Tax=Campylobacter troglodytis TaxID=654363 RepID=UPI00163B945F|nr:hypothetical protein [Campylobacter troglodytis]